MPLRWLLSGICVSFISGIILSPLLSLPKFTVFFVVLILILFYGLSIWHEAKLPLKFLPFLIFIFIGMIHGSMSRERPLPPQHIINHIGKEKRFIEGVIIDSPELLPDRTRILLDAKGVIEDGGVRPAEGKILITIGEPVHFLNYGDLIRVRTSLYRPINFNNPGQFDYVEWLRRRNIFVTGYIKDAKALILIRRKEGNSIICSIEVLRRHIELEIEKAVRSPSKEILKALILGKKGEIREEIRDLFSFTGTAHLLAISGFHMGLVVFFSFTVIKTILSYFPSILIRWNIDKISALFSIFPLLGYGIIAGMGIATIRAVIMVIVLFLSFFIGRKRDMINSVAIAAFLILLFCPDAIYEVSFQLSFSAVLAICIMVPILQKKIWAEEALYDAKGDFIHRRLWRWMVLLFLASISAIIATSPITAYHFNQVSPIGIITNIISIPLVGYGVLPLALIGGISSLLYEPISFILLKLSGIFVNLLLDFIRLASSIPYTYTYIVTPHLWEIAIFYAALILWIFGMKWRRFKWAFVAPLALLIFSIVVEYISPRFNNSLRVNFISVGDGSSVLLEFPKGRRMLIDGGGTYDDRFDVGRKIVAPFLWKMRIQRIDELVLTHPHPDHMNGLKFIARHFSIGRLWTNGDTDNTRAFREFQRIIRERNIPVRIMRKGDEELIGGVRIVVLHPPKEGQFYFGKTTSSCTNNNSLTLRISFGYHSFLFPSDIEKEAEEYILRSGGIRSTVLHVPHHGSNSSSTEEFLDEVSPGYAVISVGRKLGLPSPKVLKRLAERGIIIYRTDIHGAVFFETDGKSMRSWSFMPYSMGGFELSSIFPEGI